MTVADEATWFSGLDADMQSHIVGRGWDKMEPAAAAAEAAKSHYAAQKLIGHKPEDIIRLPKDATDPSWQTAFDRIASMATPKTPEEYTFDGIKSKDGKDLGDPDVKFLREVAAKYKLPITAARGLAADIVARHDMTVEAAGSASQLTKEANNVALRTAWGGNFDQNDFAANRAAEAVGLPAEAMEAIKMLPTDKHVATMNAFLKLSQQLNEATILRGGSPVRDPTAGLSQDQARERLNTLRNDMEWGRRFLAGDADANEEFQKLTRIAVGMPAR